jgi:uncharacterized membrane protein
MDPHLGDWLNLALRWTHLITGIAWIGSSFFFMWLDAHITPHEKPKPGVEGALWQVHSGHFYQVEKIQVAPQEMPRTLHWFKWEAAFTWISGILLLGLIYYLGAEVYMIDPAVSGLGSGAAVALGVATLVLSWAVYDLLWRSPLGAAVVPASALSLLLAVAIAYGLGEVLSGRAAYIHVGAMLGTLMVGNVWMRIIPAQRELVAAREQGREPDPALGESAKQRSVHNNYMTLPVVFIMLSNHYPGTYGHEYGWLILTALFLIGAAVRHYFNLRNAGTERRGFLYLGAAAAGMVALVVMVAPEAQAPDAAATEDLEPVAFSEVDTVIRFRCIACHSAKPSHESFDTAPQGVTFDSAEQIRRRAPRIYARAVVSKTMPLGDESGMTPEERALLGSWVRQGASLD